MLFEEVQATYLAYLEVNEYSPETIKGYQKDFRSFHRFMVEELNGAVYLDDITRDHLEDYMIYLANERGLKPRSRNRYLTSVNSLLTYAVEKSWIELHPGVSIKQAKVIEDEKVSLTEHEITELLSVIEHPILKMVVGFMSKTGLRINEVVQLELSHVKFDERRILVINGKGKKNRIVPIAESLLPDLRHYMNQVRDADSQYFFATKKTGCLSSQYVNLELHRAIEKLGWTKKVTNHTLRRSFATNLLKKDVNIVTIQKLLGHASLKTTSLYLNVEPAELHSAVNTL